jgi:hypothetical protein
MPAAQLEYSESGLTNFFEHSDAVQGRLDFIMGESGTQTFGGNQAMEKQKLIGKGGEHITAVLHF